MEHCETFVSHKQCPNMYLLHAHVQRVHHLVFITSLFLASYSLDQANTWMQSPDCKASFLSNYCFLHSTIYFPWLKTWKQFLILCYATCWACALGLLIQLAEWLFGLLLFFLLGGNPSPSALCSSSWVCFRDAINLLCFKLSILFRFAPQQSLTAPGKPIGLSPPDPISFTGNTSPYFQFFF